MNNPKFIRRFIAESAIRRSQELPISARAQLFSEISKLLTGNEKEHALLAAFSLEKFEAQQLKLTSLLQEAQK